MKEVLRLEDATFGEIIRGISFNVHENELVVVTGPNGGGKSTLAKMIMGINQPTDGRIVFDGEDVTTLSVTERAKKGISYAFQQPVKIKGVTVRDLLTAAEPGETAHPEAFLKEVGLEPEEYLDRELSGTLSGGELKRVEIASLIARDSKLMIFDEPEAGIDLWSFADLVAVFQKLREKHTIIIISHQERIIRLADRVIVIEGGRIAKECTPGEFLEGVK